ncbi:hypothetical protein N431DRAFT_461694 [Stipitochalara longipes BDJ]|nr:hypothetical protein N431DRAFT_461694 [Stipitochalara longipes BDJ]
MATLVDEYISVREQLFPKTDGYGPFASKLAPEDKFFYAHLHIVDHATDDLTLGEKKWLSELLFWEDIDQMDRSHTLISMKDGALRLAVPTAEYAKMVQDIEQEVAFEESLCGQMPYNQRHSRIETLLEFAVWKHIWKHNPNESSAHAPMLTRSWRHYDQPMDPELSPQHLAPTAPPRMGEFHYDRKQRILGHISTAAPDLFPSPQPRSRSAHAHRKQHHELPSTNQPSLYLRSGVAYPQVPNTPEFNPSPQLRELFPSQSQLPPIGTGRPSTYPEEPQPIPARNTVSITSRPLQTSGTYVNPFAESLKSYLKDSSHQQRPNSAIGSDQIEITSRRRPSTSEHRPELPHAQIIARGLSRHGVRIRSDSSSRKSSVSTRRSSQAETHDRHRKPGDNSTPRGILKKRRDSLSRRAAAAARAAIARCPQASKELSSEEVIPKVSERSWAQVAASEMKKEPLEDNDAVQDISPQPSVTVKEGRLGSNNVQTWAQIAAAKWTGNKSEQELHRKSCFGKPSYNFEQYRLKTKDDGIKMKIEKEPQSVLGNGRHTIPIMPKAMLLEQKIRMHHRASGRDMSQRTVRAGL